PPPCSTLFPYTTLFRSPGVRVTPRPEESADHGISDSQLAEVVNRLFRGSTDRTILIGGTEREAVVLTGEDVPTSLEELRGAEIRSEEHTSELQSRFDLV